MLINLYEKHLYKRVRNIWVIQELSTSSSATLTTDQLAIVHKPFEEVLEDITSAHEYMNSDYFTANCPEDGDVKLPQSILGWAKRMRDISDKINESVIVL